ncbi:hypothetical protein SKAU_G00003950 [Synaphobranchus kaupii]|uniref:Uncharacterized protein n=1 Tax=Synaphobranchus kaupii TaxID=118154 RepID=A0A9Q1JCP0_SYNKA|nr:hypothetical protein SKAU_G00003950 [Synaphobranchus kaupii]
MEHSNKAHTSSVGYEKDRGKVNYRRMKPPHQAGVPKFLDSARDDKRRSAVSSRRSPAAAGEYHRPFQASQWAGNRSLCSAAPPAGPIEGVQAGARATGDVPFDEGAIGHAVASG